MDIFIYIIFGLITTICLNAAFIYHTKKQEPDNVEFTTTDAFFSVVFMIFWPIGVVFLLTACIVFVVKVIGNYVISRVFPQQENKR